MAVRQQRCITRPTSLKGSTYRLETPFTAPQDPLERPRVDGIGLSAGLSNPNHDELVHLKETAPLWKHLKMPLPAASVARWASSKGRVKRGSMT